MQQRWNGPLTQLILAIACVAAAARAEADERVVAGEANVPIELALSAARAYRDIFQEVDVDVEFQGPGDAKWTVPAFWAGEAAFRVRFAAPMPGHYTWRSVCNNPQDIGLHGQTGELEIRPYQGRNPLYRHGRLRIAATHRTLEHADGTPFFWLGDTWWDGLTSRLDWPDGMRRLTADRVAKGFNVIQIVAGPLPDFNATVDAEVWHPLQANEGGWPWQKGWARINPAFFDRADLKIKHLVDNGLAPCIVGMWGYYLPVMGIERVQRHWRYLMARYGAYPVVWCLAGEVNMPTYLYMRTDAAPKQREEQKEGWTTVGRWVRQHDPFHNPMTAHPSSPDSRAMVLDESILDLDLLQTGHGGYASLKPSVQTVAACNAKSPRMPVVNSEVCYEGILNGSWQDVQRFLFYTSILSGSAGHTYGAQGIWGMSSRTAPYVGWTGSWGDGFWQDAMHYPGSAQMGIGRRLLERYPWWLFEPRKEPRLPKIRCAAFAAGIPGAVAVFYFPKARAELLGMTGTPIHIEPGASYQAFYFNPRNGEEIRSYEVRGFRRIELKTVSGDEDGFWTPPPTPGENDWLLVLENREALEKICPSRQ